MRIPFDQIEHEEYTSAVYEGRPFTGTAFYECDGIVVEECDFVDGSLHGLRREFYRDGSPKWSTQYLHGREHGQEQSFYPSGRLERMALYENGILLEQVEYGENGQKIGEYTAASGVRTEWRLDGSLRKVTIYEPASDNRHSALQEERYYNANGQPTLVHTDAGWDPAKRSENTI